MYAQIEASKYDTKEIIKRLVRKSRIDKSELGGPRVCGSSPCPPAPEISIASNTGAPVLRQGVPLESDRTLETTSMSASIGRCLSESDGGNAGEMKTLLSTCLSSMTALADLNKHLLARHNRTSTPGPAALENLEGALEFGLDYYPLGNTRVTSHQKKWQIVCAQFSSLRVQREKSWWTLLFGLTTKAGNNFPFYILKHTKCFYYIYLII